MKNVLTTLILFILLAANSTAADEAQGKPETSPADVSGTWNLSVDIGGSGGNPVVTLKQDGEKLTGQYSGALGQSAVTGVLKGKAVSFAFQISGQNERVAYEGTVDGNQMKGTLVLGSWGKGSFTGTKQPKKPAQK